MCKKSKCIIIRCTRIYAALLFIRIKFPKTKCLTRATTSNWHDCYLSRGRMHAYVSRIHVQMYTGCSNYNYLEFFSLTHDARETTEEQKVS